MLSSHHHHGPNDSALGHSRSQALGLRSLGLAAVITTLFGFVELFAGLHSGSLALISDAGHMATDSSALLIALFAQLLARKPPTEQFSYGFGRIEALAALLNGLLLMGLTVWIAFEAYTRFQSPGEIEVSVLLTVAVLGLAVNLLVAWSLSRDRHDLNTKAALAHVMGDLLGSVAAITAGVAIWAGAPLWVDPLLSLFISVLIVRAAWVVTSSAFSVLMERTPSHVSGQEIAHALAEIPNVKSVHNLHIWELAPGQIALTAHLHVEDLQLWARTLEQAQALLHGHGIDHVTLQPD